MKPTRLDPVAGSGDLPVRFSRWELVLLGRAVLHNNGVVSYEDSADLSLEEIDRLLIEHCPLEAGDVDWPDLDDPERVYDS